MSSDLFELVKCSVIDYEHIVDDPISLTCGHLICNSCQANSKETKCGICDTLRSIDSNSKKCDTIKSFIGSHLNQLFSTIETKYHNLLATLKEKISDYQQSIENRFDFLKEEVDILVDSLKIELENLGDAFKTEIDNTKATYLDYKLPLFNLNDKNENFNSVLEKYTSQHEKTNDTLIEFQNELRVLDKTVKNSFKHGINVTLANQLQLETLGRVNISNDIKFQIKAQKYDILHVNRSLIGICNIKDEYLIASDSTERTLIVYDSNFKEAREISSINNVEVYPHYIVTNRSDRIYITSECDNKLIMTDIDFNFMRYVKKGIIDKCYGIYYYKNNVYVCDYGGSKIIKFDEDLNENVDYALDIYPTQIQVFGQSVCVRGWNRGSSNNSISFYDLSSFQLKIRLDNLLGDIFAYESILYQHNYRANRFDLYNENGDKIDSIATDGYQKCIQDNGWRGLCLFRGRLIHTTSLYHKKALIVI